MKNLALATIMLLRATPAFADMASRVERTLFCNSIEASLEEQAADMALDTKACLKNRSIRLKSLGAGVREIGGTVKFNSPGPLGFGLKCTATYSTPLTSESVVKLKACD